MLCGPVVEQRDADGQTAADYDSRSLMQFCQSHQLLLGTYELLSRQHESTVGTLSALSSADEHDIKSVSLPHISWSSWMYVQWSWNASN